MTVKWSAFSSGSAIGGSDIPVGLQSGNNVQWTWSQVNTYITGGGTLSIASGKTFTASNTLTLTGTDSTSFAFPSSSDTVAGIGTAQTWTAVQTFTNSDIRLLGSSTGYTTFTSANAGASNFTLTFPVTADGSDTIIQGLPVAVPNQTYAQVPAACYISGAVSAVLVPVPNGSTAKFIDITTGAAILNSALSTLSVRAMLIYVAA